MPQPFHLYSMRQAIEEGFILDVLQNYMTYQAYYELEKAIEDDPLLNGRRGQQRVARYANLHPTAIGQKVEIIVEHFRRHVMGLLNGQAKAMIVTSSREHALRYYLGVRDYIKAQGYTDLKALVAFSGELKHDGETYTEADLNAFSETELPSRFDGFKKDGTPYADQYQILIVAEKYQTGFDQPKLCAMYVDRKLAGLQAVQTLSRLNRTRQGKDKTFVLDFRNSIEDIQNAFRPYFEVTALEANSDPNLVYDLEGRLFKFGYLDKDEIERFAATYYKGPLDGFDRARLEALVRAAVARFEADEDEGRQEEFRQLLRSYMRFYGFIAQVVRLADTGLEKLSAYGAWLVRLLPNREVPPDIEITEDMLRLQAFRVENKEDGSASLGVGDTRGAGTDQRVRRQALHRGRAEGTLGDRQGVQRAPRHGVHRGGHAPLRAGEPRHHGRGSDRDAAQQPAGRGLQRILPGVFQGAIRMFQKDNEMRNIVLTDADARDKATRHFFNRALREARESDGQP